MAAPQDSGTPASSDRLDALRRGLYRPGTTDADVRRYLEERATVEPPASQEVRPSRTARRRPIAAAAGAAVLVVGAIAAGAVVAQRPAPPVAAPTASPAALRHLVEDVGDGQTLTVREGATITSSPASASLRGVEVPGRLFEGSGDAVIRIDPPSRSDGGGRAVVLLTSNGPVPVAWRALASVPVGQWTASPVVLARGVSAEPPGTPAPQTFAYADSPPSRIAVAAPSGVRWSVLVAVVGSDPAPR